MRITLLCLILLLLSVVGTVAAAETPFQVTVSPAVAEGAPGGSVLYTITITSASGFRDPIVVTMDVSSMGYSRHIDVGTYRGPYPATYTYTMDIPSNTPGGVSADVKVVSSSGAYQQQQLLTLTITGQGGPLDAFIGTITSLVNSVLKQISQLTGGG
jgi:hypothetical protein